MIIIRRKMTSVGPEFITREMATEQQLILPHQKGEAVDNLKVWHQGNQSSEISDHSPRQTINQG